MSLPGCDVSSFNGPPADWKTDAGKISWAAVKITELEPGGNRYVNPDASADWLALKQMGKGRIAYMFGHPSVSAADSVSFFLEQVSALGLSDSDAVALDHETTDGLGPAACAAWAVGVTDALRKQAGRTPVLYTFQDFALEGYCAGLGHLPLWIAEPSEPAGHPVVPSPWKDWAIHQFSTSGDIDRDVARYATLDKMAAALGKHDGTTAWHCAGDRNLRQIAEANGVASSTVLRVTATADKTYPADVAAWLDDVFSGTRPATSPVPAGCVLRVPSV